MDDTALYVIRKIKTKYTCDSFFLYLSYVVAEQQYLRVSNAHFNCAVCCCIWWRFTARAHSRFMSRPSN